jgi:hypothetical protein
MQAQSGSLVMREAHRTELIEAARAAMEDEVGGGGGGAGGSDVASSVNPMVAAASHGAPKSPKALAAERLVATAGVNSDLLYPCGTNTGTFCTKVTILQ